MADDPIIAVPLADGRWLALTSGELAVGLDRAAGIPGLAPATMATSAQAAVAERLVTSQQLADIVGVGDTTLEAMAARGEIPCVRIGKALRFQPAEVIANLRHADTSASGRTYSQTNHAVTRRETTAQPPKKRRLSQPDGQREDRT